VSATTPSLSRGLLLVMAVAVGIIVANLYYLQPLLHQVRRDFAVSTASASTLMTLAQLGYAAGLAFLVPLGDLVARRRLVTLDFLVAGVLMALGAVAHSFVLFAACTFVIGVVSVGGQIIVPFAADLATREYRGRVIAWVMTGLLMGILLSRTVAGLLAQAAGWRSVYGSAALALIVTAAVLYRALPDEPARAPLRYRALVASTFALLVTSAPLRRRAWYGAVVFASFNVLWTTLSFHLAGAPFHYSNAVIGLFGLFGVAGVLAAGAAGHLADRRRTRDATVVTASLVTLAYGVLWLGRASAIGLALGIVLLDAGMQGTHITNQSVIYGLAPGSRSRVNSAYMVCCFLGAALGSYGAGQVYATAGWTGDCWLGAALSLGLVIPAAADGLTRRVARPATRGEQLAR
jgi:predicted MFS family arabinose efflux permease